MAYLMFRIWASVINSKRFFALMANTGICVLTGSNGSGKSLVMVETELETLAGQQWTCFDLEHAHHAPFADHASSCEVCTPPVLLAYAPTCVEDIDHLMSEGVLCDEGRNLFEANAFGDRLVYSTVPLTESRGVPARLYRPLIDYVQLITIEHADVLFDEVAGIADSSGSASMPVQVINWQHKLRKADIRQRVTTPAFARCALPIRQVAQVVVECQGYWPTRSQGKLWRPRRVVMARAYDAFAFEDFLATDGQRKKLKPMARALIWVPKSKAIHTYNSFGQVLQLGHITESGMCMACSGHKPRPRCTCPPRAVEIALSESADVSA